MKQLLLVRHAKSDWNTGAVNDFDRPLNERGHRDAPEMAKRLIKKNIAIDAFVSSDAVRALTTATYFAKAFDTDPKEIIALPDLYLAQPQVFFEVITGLKNDNATVAIFSHNPGITRFVNMLVKNTRIDDMPTCAVFAVKSNISHWKEFTWEENELWFFDYPKNFM